ncbi:23S rRNA (adenine(1618)-N(6))-methyltransferase RlmF [Rhodocytophaga rosea]|uniref:Ribosomal RNA large subunit methyltransferase F n=1 Tax=Rhodocytophaga rosea TaxID=2704465 RepID=A0A6C0GVC3_9BACT|nr:23S rRNA (adenine(1618)-N(6))-methyltransferase RlmF [Rhodocytophaga rosea]QHT71817.1 23S rRNA (adenine(1618)-N(6))-methyltransferase RlmF [Rhodocytophaga rosea]
MVDQKKIHPREKSTLHLRNKHRARYDFKLLMETCPQLASYVKLNLYGDESIDFFNPQAVQILNKALLKHYYQIDYWHIPANYLSPPIPSRADYIHYIADLLGSFNVQGQIPRGNKIKCLDIGTGANCVYPIIGHAEYGWSFVGTDIDAVSIASANKIIESNPSLQGHIACRIQPNPKAIFQGIIQKEERFDITICNPPFHASLAEAQAGAVRKLSNLKHKKVSKPILNFGGQPNELWCPGGEEKFITHMISESKRWAVSCLWFSTLVSKQTTLPRAYQALKKQGVVQTKTIPMRQGNKTSRILAWTFLSQENQRQWMKGRW